MEYRAKLQFIKGKMLRGEISYDEAKAEANPIIKEMNERSAVIAKEFGQRHKPFSFNYLMR